MTAGPENREGNGQAGAGDPFGQGGQPSPNKVTTTSSSKVPVYTGIVTATSASPLVATPSSSSSATAAPPKSSSKVNKGVIIGSVIGSIYGLLMIALLVFWLLHRRRKKKIAEKRGPIQPVTYSGLNECFRGVPFSNSNHSQQEDILLPSAAFKSTNTSQQDLSSRGAHDPFSTFAGVYREEERGTFLPTYAESQSVMPKKERDSLARLSRLDTSSYTRSEFTVSPLSTHIPCDDMAISPQSIKEPTLAESQDTRDTMGFPIERGIEDISLLHETSIVEPAPVHPSVHQDSIERVVRQSMMSVESGALGAPHGIRILPHENDGIRDNGIEKTGSHERMESQRTIDTVSSLGVISDGGLDGSAAGSVTK